MIRNIATKLILVMSAAFAVNAAMAESKQSPAAMALQRKLAAEYPNTKFTSVVEAPVSGLFEVTMGSNVVYMDDTGRYWFFGNVFDTRERKDLTAQRKDEVGASAQEDGARVDLSKLNKALAIKTVRGNGQRVMYVFSDPNCGYCKQFERGTEALTDVTIYTFVVPFLGDDSYLKTAAIWCSKDKLDAYKKWMLVGIAPEQRSGCTAPTGELARMATAMGIQATPTIISGDGRVQAGAMGLTALNAWLNNSRQNVSMR